MKKIMWLSLLCLALPAQGFAAGDANKFMVTKVRVDKNGKGYIQFDTALVNSPATCSTHPSHLAFDTNTPGGQGILSLALTANSSGKRIWARGTGDCSIYGTVESWSWGYITE